MLEFDRNAAIDASLLMEFFARCGWEDPEAVAKLEWLLASSEEWIVCRLGGQLVGFGRSYRLNPVDRIVFEAAVDPRLQGTGLKDLITHMLKNAR